MNFIQRALGATIVLAYSAFVILLWEIGKLAVAHVRIAWK